ncbi:DUF885 domain-containing protein [Novosphingobium clariflavum]|uniref:DUF885 domain-containing protein n=1 Tax=Novosphingobium clariflavum TaxID=2029884 RepID=A0ABV6SA92_9SPHN|nr:DUF885 domain-containing protein [Novosphingobium clariflavum]
MPRTALIRVAPALAAMAIALTSPVHASAQSVAAATPSAPAKPAWVVKSDAETQKLLQLEAAFMPENASSMGLTAFDGKVADLSLDADSRLLAAYQGRLTDIRGRISAEQQPEVRQDLEILAAYLQRQIDSIQTRKRLLMDWIDLPQMIASGFNDLLSDQTPPERRARAAERLRRYVGSEPGTKPAVELAKAQFLASRDGHLGPYRRDVEQAIGNTATYIQGVRALFTKFGIKGADGDLAKLDKQLTEYARWEQATVLPAARAEYRLPEQVYALNLQQLGIDIDPRQLIDRAARGYYVTRAQMQALAPVVAAKFGFKATDYPSVIRELKKNVIPADQVEARYRKVNAQLEDIVRREGILTLPTSQLRMRLATPAEAAAIPAPHMSPPRLIGNTGEQGEFILTTGNSQKAEDAYDDFGYDAATWTLSAHEARPGHELQFAAMVDRGVSLARALYAFNSVNAEGWALYAEGEMLPYEPVEGQLIALQGRLQRQARAMLDPMLNLGLIDVDSARRVLRDEVVLSKGMADQEIDRYTFRMPGQAGSYYYGFEQLAQLRVKTEKALGPAFDRKAYHDFLLSQGLLPLSILATTVERDFIPAQKAAAATR